MCPEREVHAQIQMRRHTGRKGIKTQSLHLQKSLNRPAVQCDPMLRLPHTAGRARHPVACEDGCGRCRAPCTRLAGATLAACEDEHTEYITWVGRSLWRVQEQCRSSLEGHPLRPEPALTAATHRHPLSAPDIPVSHLNLSIPLSLKPPLLTLDDNNNSQVRHNSLQWDHSGHH